MRLHITPMSIVSDSRAARQAEQKRKAADRARAYRARLRAARMPAARDVDAALAEALAFHLARDGAATSIGPAALMRTARLILEREGHDPVQAAQSIADRLVHRDEHLDPHHVPSLRPGPPERIRPTKSGEWQTPMGAILAHLAG